MSTKYYLRCSCSQNATGIPDASWIDFSGVVLMNKRLEERFRPGIENGYHCIEQYLTPDSERVVEELIKDEFGVMRVVIYHMARLQ